jgi:prepilin-type processing-associated H-X9-DG protein
MTQINAPAMIFTFLDERADSINDACFLSDPDHPFWMIDYPASYHDGAAAFSFVDGHGDVHKWQDPRTMPPLKPGTFLPLNIHIDGDVDTTWIQLRASEVK